MEEYKDLYRQLCSQDLSQDEFSLLLVLMVVLDFAGFTPVVKKELGQILNMDTARVIEVMDSLCAREVLVKGERAGRNFLYKLNPLYCLELKPSRFDDLMNAMPNADLEIRKERAGIKGVIHNGKGFTPNR